MKSKINRSSKDESEHGALTRQEYNAVLRMLKPDSSVKGRQDYAMVRFLVNSGLRASEAVGLTWGQIDELEDSAHVTQWSVRAPNVQQ